MKTLSDVVAQARKSQIFEPDNFWARYNTCAEEIISSVGECGIRYDGLNILDIGSGDGIIDLSVTQRTGCKLIGIDTIVTDKKVLLSGAARYGVALKRGSLDFELSSNGLGQLGDEYFDHAFSRDVFEHVQEPVSLLKAIHRVLKPNGTLCIQVWPFWHSEWGAHLFERQEHWEHLVRSQDEILSRWEGIWQAKTSYESCARTTLDDLQRACLVSGFRAMRVELVTPVFSPPEFADHLRWSEMGIAGVKVVLKKVGSRV